MTAVDTFKKFVASLSEEARKAIRDLIREQNAGLLAARSEDARVRLVSKYIEEIRERLRHKK